MVEVKDYKGKQSPKTINKIQKKLGKYWWRVFILVRSLSEFQQQIKKLFMKTSSRLHIHTNRML
jgi:hypothetical protein